MKKRGKKAALDLLVSNKAMCTGIQRLGQEFQVSQELHTLCEKFVCLLYGSTSYTDVNSLRYHMFAAKATQSEHLPPTKDALQQHVLRANYQAGIWMRSLQARPEIPDPAGNGWRVVDDCLTVEWMLQRPPPDELLVLVHCRCQTGCASGRCSCVLAGLPCTDACSCKDCENKVEDVHCRCQTGCASGRCSCVRAGLPCTDACSCGDCENKVEEVQGPAIEDGDDNQDDDLNVATSFIDDEAEVA